MSDLKQIQRVLSRYAAEIINIDRVIGDWENQIRKYKEEIEDRLPELDEYFRIESLPYQERRDLPDGVRNRYNAGYMLFVKVKGFPKSSFVRLHNLGGGKLFLALLQKYEIPNNLRKKVEAAAKFWSKTRVNDPPRGKEVEAFQKVFQMYKDHLALAKAAVEQSIDRSAAPDKVKMWTAGPFRLVNTGGFDDRVMEDCVEVVEKAARLLVSKGLGKVCYGDVLISNTVGRSSRILAFYLTDKDEMFVRANIKSVKQDALWTVIHELGHRLQFKFMSGKTREITDLWYQIKRMSEKSDYAKIKAILDDSSLRPKPGDILKEKGKTFVVDNVLYDKVVMHLEENPRATAKIPLLSYARIKGLRVDVPDIGFVTQYASKDPAENFAEMIAAYCLGTLPDPQVEMLEAIL